MVDITSIHVHYRDLKGKPKVKKITPTNAADKLAIKADIGEFVQTLKGKAEYYYVVIEIDSDGRSAYRTVVPKTMLD